MKILNSIKLRLSLACLVFVAMLCFSTLLSARSLAGGCIECTAEQGENLDQCVHYEGGSESCPSYTVGTDCCGNKNVE